MTDEDKNKETILSKIKYVEVLMKGEVFDVLKERGEDIPVVYMDSSVPAMSGSDNEE